MKPFKISSDKSRVFKSPGTKPIIKPKKSQSTEGLNTKNPARRLVIRKNSPSNKPDRDQLFTDRDLAELALNDEFGAAFEKFWKTVTDGMDKKQQDAVPRSTPIDNKITEMQKRIKLNQAILKNANERMKGISFAAERQNLSQWKEGLAFKNPSREELNRFKDVKALDLEIQKLRESKPDRNVFLKSSPGIVNFHETMENTLSMLDKIQKADDLDNYEVPYRDIKSEFNLDFIKTPNLVAVSDEE